MYTGCYAEILSEHLLSETVTDEDNTGGQHVAIRTDSLVPDGDLMGHEELPPVPTPLEPPFSNILKRDSGKNFKDTVNNFTYVALMDDVKGYPVQVLREHPPPSLELQIHTPTPVAVQHHIIEECISSNLQVQ